MTDKIPTITGKRVKPCRHDAGHSCALAVTVVIPGLTNCYAGTDRAHANTNSYFFRKCWGSKNQGT